MRANFSSCSNPEKLIKNANFSIFLLDPVVKPRDDSGEIEPCNNAGLITG
ncbi:MAG: palindromic element RPE4 domain-containing protein [Rickettsia endosymbiont of Ecitomorpha arachnoides]|nr:palindromic element RPE4 domain-containing protein [Rickettsia endosymbiont of Ecitomorpha arachnoides]